jgi:hypothetical protein
MNTDMAAQCQLQELILASLQVDGKSGRSQRSTFLVLGVSFHIYILLTSTLASASSSTLLWLWGDS